MKDFFTISEARPALQQPERVGAQPDEVQQIHELHVFAASECACRLPTLSRRV